MAGELADRTLQGLVAPGRLAIQVEGRQELRAGFACCRPSLADSRQCCRKIKILISRPLHDAREHRVVEAIPPGLQGRRRSARRTSFDRDGTVKLLQRHYRLSIRRTDGATR